MDINDYADMVIIVDNEQQAMDVFVILKEFGIYLWKERTIDTNLAVRWWQDYKRNEQKSDIWLDSEYREWVPCFRNAKSMAKARKRCRHANTFINNYYESR